ncbi:MAG TPA: ABC-2 family transporter protein [Pseudonocardiaceae bacterium]|nr:ABC-2 family transporter protein [Pseudonocardiaceae bacterium]
MGERLAIYRGLLAASVRSQLAYPASFALQCLAQALVQLEDMIVVVVLFSRISTMGGFTLREVLLVYSLAGISFGLADLLVGSLDTVASLVRTGRLDALLLRPLPAMAQICVSDFALRRLGKVATSLAVLGYVLAVSDITWTPLRVAILLITPLTGVALLGAVWVAATATTFWLVEGQELPNAVTYGSGMFTSYPVSVFSGWLLRLMAFVVPGAFVAYYPALAILGKPDPLGLPPVLRYSAPLVAVLAAGVAALVWRAGLRHYVGTGS